MKLLKYSFTTLLISLFVIGLATQTNAQDRRGVVQSYNKGIELKNNGEFEQAINVFNQTIASAGQLGEEGQDIVERCEQQLVNTQYRLAVNNYQNLKKNQSLDNFDATISAFKDVQDVAKEYNNSQMVNKVNQLIPQLLYQKGVYAYKSGNKQASLAALNEAVERNPNYSTAYYQIALVKKNTKGTKDSEIIADFEKALQVAQKENNSSVINETQKQLGGIYLSNGYELVDKQKEYDQGIENYKKALQYTPQSSQVYYRLAEAYNKTQQWQQAVQNAQKGLDLESGGKTEQAKYYFEMGTAYKGMGQKGDACTAFGNAAYGSFKNPAEHQMEYELKCESTTN